MCFKTTKLTLGLTLGLNLGLTLGLTLLRKNNMKMYSTNFTTLPLYHFR